jgi:transposase InsO family protein
VVPDVFGRRIIGWATATHPNAEPVLNARDTALDQPQPPDAIRRPDLSSRHAAPA